MHYICFSLITLILLSNPSNAQEKWDLKKCVEYATANGFSIKQAELQTKLADIQYKQSKLSQYPSLIVGNSNNASFGLRENPTTGIYENQEFFNVGLTFQSSALIFNWFSKKNTIAANEYEALAAKASVDKQKNDLSLIVANNYLLILLAKEQEAIARVQLEQSIAQLSNTRKLVDAGALPEINAAELEAQVARDTSSVITAKGNVQQAILNLKANLNLDAAADFDVETPPVEMIPIDPIADLQPGLVYALAIKNLPQQQVNDFRYKAGEKSLSAAKGAMNPTINAFGNIGSNYVYYKTPIYDKVFTGVTIPTGLIVNTGTITYPVLSPVTKQGGVIGYIKPDGLGEQLNNNLGQNIGLNIGIPIFNGSTLRSNYERSKVNLQSLSLQKDIDNQKIKQDIYLAYNSAVVSLEKFNASKKSVATSQRSYDFAQKRYAAGMLSTLELITSQNNLFRSKLEMVLNQFDYVFKMKVLEFYKGLGIRL